MAFHALNDGNDVQTAAYGTIILSHVVTNIGNAYDPMTGVFTVPVSGLYDFQASILSAHVGTGQHAYAAIYVDSDRAALAISDTGFGPWNQATMKSRYSRQRRAEGVPQERRECSQGIQRGSV